MARLAVTEDIQERLGAEICEALRRRFHPTGECAVCGRTLSAEPVTISVQPAHALLLVTVHHVRCARGRWIKGRSLMVVRDRTCVTMAGCMWLTARRGWWPWPRRRHGKPFVLVNPWVDGATLRRTDGGGLIDADMEALAAVGFPSSASSHPPESGVHLLVRVRSHLAEIDGPLGTWEADLPAGVGTAIRTCGGLTVWVGTGLDLSPPLRLGTDELRPLVERSRALWAWAPLAE